MKDKTHSMNRGYTSQEASDGFERLSPDEVQNFRQRKNRQLNWAGLLDDKDLTNYENTNEASEQDAEHMDGGFLPRSNYEDRN